MSKQLIFNYSQPNLKIFCEVPAWHTAFRLTPPIGGLLDSLQIPTFPIMTLAAFQLRSFGIFLVLFANRTMTAAVTVITADGGLVKALSSVRLF